MQRDILRRGIEASGGMVVGNEDALIVDTSLSGSKVRMPLSKPGFPAIGVRMPLNPSQFEKLGAFYLGRPLDPETGAAADTPLLYDSRDLLTHAVCVGMTGSGKTGLCLALLEEAAIDGVPAILIDPKGDIANLALTFPDLKGEDFRPWIDEEEAERAGRTSDEYAQDQADLWRKGLAKWGQGPERIRLLKEKAEVRIYTPGSTSGIPVNVMASFKAPRRTDAEGMAESAQNASASLLGLLKIPSDPLTSREGIFLSNLLTSAWGEGRDVDLGLLIEMIQRPPFEKVGILDLETYFPAKERFALVMALNNILASPGFAAWREGEPLDIAGALYSTEGRPRHSIFSIAHLGEDERMFFVSLLLNEVLAWTRAQSGTTSLRAILYMDEIFGFLPPSANPPSKRPMMTLLKQARAYGLGVVLATQNPVDLDYKALSNAGTWFLGRLQTERDQARVLDGLEGATSGGAFNRKAMTTLLAGLGKRVFVMNNVNDSAPTVFETRWVMSYLRGPLTRDQIGQLMSGKATHDEKPAEVVAATESRPALPPGIHEIFLSTPGADSSHYHPVLCGTATVAFKRATLELDHHEDVFLCAKIPASTTQRPDWTSARRIETTQQTPSEHPSEGAQFEPLPSSASRPANYALWEKAFRAWLGTAHTLEIYRSANPKLISQPGEPLTAFQARVALACREARDKMIDSLRKKFSIRSENLQSRIEKAGATLRQRQEKANQSKLQSAISVGSTLLGAFLGKKRFSAGNIGRATTAARGIGRTMQTGSSVEEARQSLENLQAQLADLNGEFETECASVRIQEPDIETLQIKPTRGGITNASVCLAWVPES